MAAAAAAAAAASESSNLTRLKSYGTVFRSLFFLALIGSCATMVVGRSCLGQLCSKKGYPQSHFNDRHRSEVGIDHGFHVL